MLVAYPLQAALAKEMGEEFVSNGLVGKPLRGCGRTSSACFPFVATYRGKKSGRSPAAIRQEASVLVSTR